MKPQQPEVPHRHIFPLLQPLVEVECWNCSTQERFTVPAGQRVRLDNAHYEDSMVVCLVDSEDKSMQLPGRNGAYRFIVPNATLQEAIGIPLSSKQYDLVGALIQYESGQATPAQEKKLMSHLHKTGIGKKLQGHYSSRM